MTRTDAHWSMSSVLSGLVISGLQMRHVQGTRCRSCFFINVRESHIMQIPSWDHRKLARCNLGFQSTSGIYQFRHVSTCKNKKVLWFFDAITGNGNYTTVDRSAEITALYTEITVSTLSTTHPTSAGSIEELIVRLQHRSEYAHHPVDIWSSFLLLRYDRYL